MLLLLLGEQCCCFLLYKSNNNNHDKILMLFLRWTMIIEVLSNIGWQNNWNKMLLLMLGWYWGVVYCWITQHNTNLNAAVVRWTLRWCLWRPTLPVRCILVAGRTSYSCFRIRCKLNLNMFCMLHLCSKKGNSEILYLGVPKQIGTTWQLSQICLLGNHSTLLYCTPTKTT